MSERFTVVFAGRVQDIPGNPYKVESLFGEPVAIDHADVLADNERLRAENERLRAALVILQAAMTKKKPIPMAFKKAIIDARAALDGQPAPGKEASDE